MGQRTVRDIRGEEAPRTAEAWSVVIGVAEGALTLGDAESWHIHHANVA